MNKMREVRKEKGLSMTKLSMKSGVAERYLYLIERGDKNPSLKTAKAIADALDSSIDYIFCRKC